MAPQHSHEWGEPACRAGEGERRRRPRALRGHALGGAGADHTPRAGLAAGIHAVAALPDHADKLEVVSRARERAIGLYPMSCYRADGQTRPPRLALGFGNLTEPAITRGIATVSDLLS